MSNSASPAELQARAQVPGLLMQPLLENAICHGIEPRPGGNRIALDNIRERMELLYPGRSSVEANRVGDEAPARERLRL